MATIQLPNDFKELLQFLNKNNVEYLLVGGYAVGYHGYVRATGDINFWVRLDPANATNIVSALREFGFGSEDLSPDIFLEPGRVIRIGNAPLRVEFQTTISGVEFADCWPARELTELDGIPVNIISLKGLKVNKKASGRLKDQADRQKLNQIPHIVAEMVYENSEGRG